MTKEEKAKAYDRTKEALIDMVKCAYKRGVIILGEKEKEEYIAWLEKQDRKPQGKSAQEEKVDNQNCVKLADKVEPNQKWSEEEESMIRCLEGLVKDAWAKAETEHDDATVKKMSNIAFFLKTIKPWKK